MRRPRITIAWCMIATAVVAVNVALVRAFLVHEMFYGAILAFAALQVGVVCFLRTRGRARRFWLGFEVSGAAAVLALFSCEVFADSALTRWLLAYTEFAANLVFSHLPTAMADDLMDHQVPLLVVLYFAPELLVALLGGMITASLFNVRRTPVEIPPGKDSGER